MGKKRKKKSKFGKNVASDVQTQKAAASSYGYLRLPKNVSVYKEQPGRGVLLDIIPYLVTDKHHADRNEENDVAIVGEQWYKVPFKVHRNIGSDNQKVVCPTSIGKKCPICEYRAKLIKEGADKEDTDVLKTTRRNLYFIVPREHKKIDEELHVWDVSYHLFQRLLNEELEEDESYYSFPDLEDGYTLKIRFDEESFAGNKYAAASRIDFVERDEQLGEDFIENVPSLDDVLSILPYPELEKLFHELEDEEEEDEDEEPTPKKGRKKKNRKEVVEEEEEEDEEEEEEEPMKRKGKKKEAPKKSKKSFKKPNCPHDGTFGEDVDDLDECDSCPLYDACATAYEEG